jgi:hypothetical protein
MRCVTYPVYPTGGTPLTPDEESAADDVPAVGAPTGFFAGPGSSGGAAEGFEDTDGGAVPSSSFDEGDALGSAVAMGTTHEPGSANNNGVAPGACVEGDAQALKSMAPAATMSGTFSAVLFMVSPCE